jgi:IMP dehydrogenase
MPVIKDNKLIGMVTLSDVVKGIISEQKFTIKELEKYISGGYEI